MRGLQVRRIYRGAAPLGVRVQISNPPKLLDPGEGERPSCVACSAQVEVLRAWGPLHAARTPALVPQHDAYLARKAGELDAARSAAMAAPAHAQVLAWPAAVGG